MAANTQVALIRDALANSTRKITALVSTSTNVYIGDDAGTLSAMLIASGVYTILGNINAQGFKMSREITALAINGTTSVYVGDSQGIISVWTIGGTWATILGQVPGKITSMNLQGNFIYVGVADGSFYSVTIS